MVLTARHSGDRLKERKKWCDLRKIQHNKNTKSKTSNTKRKKELWYERTHNNANEVFDQARNIFEDKNTKKTQPFISKEEIMLAYLDHLKNPELDTEVFKQLKKFWTQTYNEKMVAFYNNALDNPAFSVVSMGLFNKDEFYINPGRDDFFDSFLRASWLNDKKNQKILYEICKKKLKKAFPEALENYGMPDDFLFRDIPQDKFSKNLERFVFIHSDEFLDEIISAPKLPLTNWKTIKTDIYHTIQVKKVAFRVGDECMLGEFTRNINYSNDDIIKNSGSGIKFCVYVKGLEKGKFVVSRWDYEPQGIHFNKLNNYGNIDLNGYYCEKTQHSHSHFYNLKQRLLLTQNQSADIMPTPINCNSEKVERTYGSFENMVADFEWQHYCLDEKAPVFSHNFYLKDYVLDMCPIAVKNKKNIYNDENGLKLINHWDFKPKETSQKSFAGGGFVQEEGELYERQMGEY